MEIPSSNESEMKFDRKKRKGGRLIRKREMVRESIVNWERERNIIKTESNTYFRWEFEMNVKSREISEERRE